jgi:hypothetical protein
MTLLAFNPRHSERSMHQRMTPHESRCPPFSSSSYLLHDNQTFKLGLPVLFRVRKPFKHKVSSTNGRTVTSLSSSINYRTTSTQVTAGKLRSLRSTPFLYAFYYGNLRSKSFKQYDVKV